MKKDSKKEITIKDTSHLSEIFGINDEHLRNFEDKFKVRITTRGNHIGITGDDDPVLRAERLIIRLFLDDKDADLREIFSEKIQVFTEKRFITPKSLSQKEYVYAIEKYDLVFGIGPAGTGKTYL